MKKTIKALKFSLVFSVILASFLACDKDFSVIESDVLSEQNSNFLNKTDSLQIAAYNKKLDSIQINGLSSSLLGVYNDPAYGQTIASIVAQVIPTTYSPDFGDNTVIDSVILTIPYFNRVVGTYSNGNTAYTILDSLYGEKPDKTNNLEVALELEDAIKPFKLSIFQNNYFLRDFDPNSNTNEKQNYYSKADGTVLNGTSNINFDNQKGTEIFSNSIKPSSKPTRTDVGTGQNLVTTQSPPALRQKLDNDFWQTTIIAKEGNAVLSKASDFQNYFRGLYFKTEAIAGTGSMVLLNLASTNANITIYYSKNSTVANERVQASYVLRFTGTILNTFTNDYSSVPLQNGDKNTGDEKLYLKGTEGSMGVVDLFSGLVEHTENNITSLIPALDKFKKDYRVQLANGKYKKDANGNYILKRLINDAQLLVYEDETLETGGILDLHKYDRLYAYDIKNNAPVDDYYLDPTANNTSNPFSSTIFHLGQRRTDIGSPKYKIHLTEHLNNILLRDSINTVFKLGVTLSSNVNLLGSAKILNSAAEVTAIPGVSILTPRGSKLYGTNPNVVEKKKMKLKIFYTETK